MSAKVPDMDAQMNSTVELPHEQKMNSLFPNFSTFLVVCFTIVIYARFLLSQMWRRTRKSNIVVTQSELDL